MTSGRTRYPTAFDQSSLPSAAERTVTRRETNMPLKNCCQ